MGVYIVITLISECPSFNFGSAFLSTHGEGGFDPRSQKQKTHTSRRLNFKVVNNTLLVHKGWFRFTGWEHRGNLLACVDRLYFPADSLGLGSCGICCAVISNKAL